MEKDCCYIPLLEMGNKKLDSKKMVGKLVESGGKGTELFKKIGAADISFSFPEKAHNNFVCQIGWYLPSCVNKYVAFDVMIGEGGLILKIKYYRPLSAYDACLMQRMLRPLISEAKKCMYKPKEKENENG